MKTLNPKPCNSCGCRRALHDAPGEEQEAPTRTETPAHECSAFSPERNAGVHGTHAGPSSRHAHDSRVPLPRLQVSL